MVLGARDLKKGKGPDWEGLKAGMGALAAGATRGLGQDSILIVLPSVLSMLCTE